MTSKDRFRRAVAAFAVAFAVVLPVTAMAAPPGTGTVEDSQGGGQERGPRDRSDDGKSDEAPGKSDEAPGKSDEAPGKSDEADAVDRPGRSGSAPGHVGSPPEIPGAAAPAVRPTPSGPAERARGVGAAFVLLELPDEGQAVVLVTPAEPAGLSGDLVSVLAPVMPPAVVDALTSPIVIFEALLEAMVSSGQALVIPFLAAGVGFLLPGVRRRDLVAAVVDAA